MQFLWWETDRGFANWKKRLASFLKVRSVPFSNRKRQFLAKPSESRLLMITCESLVWTRFPTPPSPLYLHPLAHARTHPLALVLSLLFSFYLSLTTLRGSAFWIPNKALSLHYICIICRSFSTWTKYFLPHQFSLDIHCCLMLPLKMVATGVNRDLVTQIPCGCVFVPRIWPNNGCVSFHSAPNLVLGKCHVLVRILISLVNLLRWARQLVKSPMPGKALLSKIWLSGH